MGYYYSPFVSHCIKFFAKYPYADRFKTNADKLNWGAVKSSLDSYTKNEATILLKLYNGNDLENNVATISRNIGMNKKSLWKIVRGFEYKVASNRGII